MNKKMEQVKSPIIKKDDVKGKEQKQFTFFDAMKEILDGKKITKLEWKDEGYYCFIKDEILLLHNPDNTLNTWIVSKADMSGTDYVRV